MFMQYVLDTSKVVPTEMSSVSSWFLTMSTHGWNWKKVLLYLVVFMIFSVPRQTCISTTISENGLGLGLGLTEDYDQDYWWIIWCVLEKHVLWEPFFYFVLFYWILRLNVCLIVSCFRAFAPIQLPLSSIRLMTTFLLGISYANIQAETSLPHPVLVSIMRGVVLLE